METFYTNNKNKEVLSKQEQLENWWVFDTIAAWSSGECALASREGEKRSLGCHVDIRQYYECKGDSLKDFKSED